MSLLNCISDSHKQLFDLIVLGDFRFLGWTWRTATSSTTCLISADLVWPQFRPFETTRFVFLDLVINNRAYIFQLLMITVDVKPFKHHKQQSLHFSTVYDNSWCQTAPSIINNRAYIFPYFHVKLLTVITLIELLSFN